MRYFCVPISRIPFVVLLRPLMLYQSNQKSLCLSPSFFPLVKAFLNWLMLFITQLSTDACSILVQVSNSQMGICFLCSLAHWGSCFTPWSSLMFRHQKNIIESCTKNIYYEPSGPLLLWAISVDVPSFFFYTLSLVFMYYCLWYYLPLYTSSHSALSKSWFELNVLLWSQGFPSSSSSLCLNAGLGTQHLEIGWHSLRSSSLLGTQGCFCAFMF